jgi:site-specific DNA-methyltransferase (adenine-specific)
MTDSLFPDFAGHPQAEPHPGSDLTPKEALGQYFTPAWVAHLLFDEHFSDLGQNDLVWEPCTGPGYMLAGVPARVNAIGSEIDPALAALAAKNTGRRVLAGDLCSIELPDNITAVFSNPPFQFSLIEKLLGRCEDILPNGGKVALVLPCSFFQTSRTVCRLNEKWTMMQQMLPRDLFNRPQQMESPITYALFQKDSAPRLVGFKAYRETAAIKELPKAQQEMLADRIKGPRSVWREALAAVLGELGGEASLSQIYARFEGRRPTSNPWWKEQLRKVAQTHFTRVSDGVYALAA